MTARPDSVPKSMPIATVIGCGLLRRRGRRCRRCRGRRPASPRPAARSTRPARACGRSAGPAARGRARRSVASMSSVRVAIAATASRAIAVSTAPAGESPQQNGPCAVDQDRRRIHGRPPRARQRLDDDPSRLRLVLAGRSRRSGAAGSPAPTPGSGPRGWCRGTGSARPACAHAVASRECVWTTPPMPGSSRYRSRCVGRVGGWAEVALDHRPVVERHDHHVVRP